MPKLFSMNVYIYIFLLHFVANKDKFFLRKKGNEKEIEFTLDLSTDGGLNFYNGLKAKANKIIQFTMYRYQSFFDCEDDFEFGDNVKSVALRKGDLGFSSTYLIIVLNDG